MNYDRLLYSEPEILRLVPLIYIHPYSHSLSYTHANGFYIYKGSSRFHEILASRHIL